MNHHPKYKGFYKLNVKSKDIQSLFKNRKFGIVNRLSLWYNPKGCKYMIVEDYNILAIIFSTILLPFLILLSLIESKSIFKEYLELFNRLEKGKYISKIIYPKLKRQSGWNSKYWKECYELHNKSKERK